MAPLVMHFVVRTLREPDYFFAAIMLSRSVSSM